MVKNVFWDTGPRGPRAQVPKPGTKLRMVLDALMVGVTTEQLKDIAGNDGRKNLDKLRDDYDYEIKRTPIGPRSSMFKITGRLHPDGTMGPPDLWYPGPAERELTT